MSYRRNIRRSRGGKRFGTPANPNFTPPSVSGALLKLWLEPSDTTSGINTIVSGGFTVLGDKTSTHVAWTQSGSADRRPTVGSIGGRQCCVGTISPSTWLNGPSVAAAFPLGSHTFWILANGQDPESGASAHHKFDSNTVGVNLYGFTDGNVYDGMGSTTRFNFGNPTPNLTTPHVYEMVSVAGEKTYRINDATVATSAVNTVGWDPTSTLLMAGIASLGASVPTNTYRGRMGTMLIYDAKLSASDATAVINSLKAWWSIV